MSSLDSEVDLLAIRAEVHLGRFVLIRCSWIIHLDLKPSVMQAGKSVYYLRPD